MSISHQLAPRRERKRLRNEVAAALVLKVLALLLLFFLFFSPSHRPEQSAEAVFHQVAPGAHAE